MQAAVSSRTTAPALAETQRFRNWKLIGFESISTALAAYLFLAWAPKFLGWVGFVVGVPLVWFLGREFRGLSIDSKGMSFPRGRLANFPVVSLGRQLRIGIAGLRELMVMEPWHGFQVVRIEGWFGSELLVFQSRDERVRFVSAFERIYPTIPIYRRARTKRE